MIDDPAHLVRSHTGARVRCLSGLNNAVGYLAEFHIQMLRGATEHAEGLISRDPLTLHQNPLGLADQFAGPPPEAP